MKTITIVSGKGGVGKSSIAASLAVLLAKRNNIIAVDCDVDAPNLALCLGVKKFSYSKELKTTEKARVFKNRCKGCKRCLCCNFDAIIWDKKNNLPKINRFKCEGCGLCELVCNYNAIKLEKVKNGKIFIGNVRYGFKIVSGKLEIGESGSGFIVNSVKDEAKKVAKKEYADFMIVDVSAGIGCSVIAALVNSDYVVGVTEPIPSALNDLKRILMVIEHFGISCGVIINKFDLNEKFTKNIEMFLNRKNIRILGKIPYDEVFIKSLVELKPVVVYSNKYTNLFNIIISEILKELRKI